MRPYRSTSGDGCIKVDIDERGEGVCLDLLWLALFDMWPIFVLFFLIDRETVIISSHVSKCIELSLILRHQCREMFHWATQYAIFTIALLHCKQIRKKLSVHIYIHIPVDKQCSVGPEDEFFLKRKNINLFRDATNQKRRPPR